MTLKLQALLIQARSVAEAIGEPGLSRVGAPGSSAATSAPPANCGSTVSGPTMRLIAPRAATISICAA